MAEKDQLSHALTSGEDGLSPAFIDALDRSWRHLKTGKAQYDFDDVPLVTAAKAAIFLSQPLILAGEPGVGKTSFAAALAERLDKPFLPPIQVKSTSTGVDLFYSFNEVARFRDATRPGGLTALRDYVNLSSLGKAIALSAGSDARVPLGDVSATEIFGTQIPQIHADESVALGNLFPGLFQRQLGPGVTSSRSVVLIDELDKAPRDTPNDILAEIEALGFEIQELGLRLRADPDRFPIIIFTSNSERSFPDAFLRRCIFHWIEPPSETRLCRIVASRAVGEGQLKPGDPLVKSAVAYYNALRDRAENKKPSTAELISFVSALVRDGYGAKERIDPADPALGALNGILLKTRIDSQSVGGG